MDSGTIDIYPNPAAGDVVWVRSEIAMREIVLYNIAGQRVLTQQMNGQKVAQLPLQQSSSGMYLLEVTVENGARSTQQIVLK